MFTPLSTNDLAKIVHIQLYDLERRLKEQEISLQMRPDATQLVLNASYIPTLGARPLRRYLEKHVTTAISRLLIEGRLTKRSTVVISASPDGKELVFHVQPGMASSRSNSMEGISNFAPNKKTKTTDRAGESKRYETNEDNIYMHE